MEGAAPEKIPCKYTIVGWDGKLTRVFPRAVLEMIGGEYVVEDLTAFNTHYGFPKENVWCVKEEPVDE